MNPVFFRGLRVVTFSLILSGPTRPAFSQTTPQTTAALDSDADGTFETIHGWTGLGEGKTLESENGNHFLRFRSSNPESTVAVEGRLKLDPSWKRVVMSAKLRGLIEARGKEGWYAPRLTFTFRDQNDKMVGDWPDVLSLSASGNDWQSVARTYEVPPGAASLLLQPGLWGTSGTFDVDDLLVQSAEAAGVPPLVAPTPPLKVAARDATAPPREAISWGQEPIEIQSTTRARVVLNGLWRWMPAPGGAPDGGWGLIRVPGLWRPNGMPGVVAPAQGNDWKNFDAATCTRGWYERPLAIPASWAARRVELDVSRVSTDAQVFVNNQKVGAISWPAGTVDISRFVTPGQTATLRMLVAAVPNEGDVLQYMDGDDIIRRKAELQSAGILGDVVLQSSPRAARLSDVFVQPSVRKKQLGLQVEVSGATGGNVQWTARLLDEKGVEETRFSAQTPVRAGDSVVDLAFP